MGRSLLGGLFRVTAAAAAVAGVAYLFKDEIRGTEAYQNLNSKYDVDTKIADATKKAKEAAAIAKDKAKEAAVVAKDKAYDLKDKAVDAYKNSPWSATDDDNIFEDDEIVLNEDGEAEKRDYVEIKTDAAEEKVEEVKEKIGDAVTTAADKLEDILKAAEAETEEISKEIDNIEID
jgi:hypothetical protein